MRSIVTIAAIAALLAAGATAGAGDSAQRAALRLTSTNPITLRGVAFKPRERVTLTLQLRSTSNRRTRKLTAGRLGGFTTSFTTLLGVDRCEVMATAVGARGSRATFKLPQAQCRPRPAIHVADLRPVTVVGARFMAGEAVTVRTVLNGKESVRRVDATPAGRFAVAFDGVNIVDRCNSDLLVQAIGARGSEAAAKVGPLPQCAPR
jgi:hypothetical protein